MSAPAIAPTAGPRAIRPRRRPWRTRVSMAAPNVATTATPVHRGTASGVMRPRAPVTQGETEQPPGDGRSVGADHPEQVERPTFEEEEVGRERAPQRDHLGGDGGTDRTGGAVGHETERTDGDEQGGDVDDEEGDVERRRDDGHRQRVERPEVGHRDVTEPGDGLRRRQADPVLVRQRGQRPRRPQVADEADEHTGIRPGLHPIDAADEQRDRRKRGGRWRPPDWRRRDTARNVHVHPTRLRASGRGASQTPIWARSVPYSRPSAPRCKTPRALPTVSWLRTSRSAPDRIRTCALRIRKPLLCPD